MHEVSSDPNHAPKRVEDRRWRPRNCVWELTLACNLRCLHCGSSAGRPRPRELGTSECLDVVDQLAALGCELITLSGGEPTLRKDWTAIAAAAVRRGVRVNMVSNGVYGSAARTSEIASRAVGAGLCNVGISIDGPREQHDALRGEGALDAALSAVEAYVKAGMKVSILTTLNRLNVGVLPQVRDVAIAAGASCWRLQLGKPMGNLKGRDDLTLDPAHLLSVMPLLASLKKQGGIDVALGDSLGYFGPHDAVLRGRGWRGRSERWGGCQAGMQAIGIESDGGVKGCLSLQARPDGIDRFREGDLTKERLEDIWFRPGIFAFNRGFRADQLTGWCRRCDHASACRGGARCVAAAFTGRVTEDPYCYHRMESLRRGERPSIARPILAAAAALMLDVSASGCAPPPAPHVVAGDVDASVDAAVPVDAGDQCANVCCECDYGLPPPAGCCTTDAGVQLDASVVDAALPDAAVDECANACCECDYGLPPPAHCCVTDAGPGGQDASALDASVPDSAVDECASACCECDYGLPPPPQCCTPEGDGGS